MKGTDYEIKSIKTENQRERFGIINDKMNKRKKKTKSRKDNLLESLALILKGIIKFLEWDMKPTVSGYDSEGKASYAPHITIYGPNPLTPNTYLSTRGVLNDIYLSNRDMMDPLPPESNNPTSGLQNLEVYVQNQIYKIVKTKAAGEEETGSTGQDGKYKIRPSEEPSNEACIEKAKGKWVFVFDNKTASVDGKLIGLPLIEYLLSHPNEEYTPLKLLQKTGQRSKGETEPQKIYSEKDIKLIKEAIAGLKGRAELTSDAEDKERLGREIEEAENELHKARNCTGKPRNFSEKFTKSVSRNTKLVLDKISPQHIELYNHLNTFLKTGEKCCYKPDKEVFWNIS